jgi:uncharacterized membrane protein YbhN (UPF0104 family)
VVGLLKLACGVLLVAYLAWRARGEQAFERLLTGEKHLGWLATGVLLVGVSVVLGFLRWRLVARAARIDLSLGEALRVGALGFSANFVALGNVGGDVVKATLVARRRPGKRAVAVTTVLVDRAMGLFALLAFASAAIVATGHAMPGAEPEILRLLSQSTLAVTAVAGACVVVALGAPAVLEGVAHLISKAPLGGATLGRVAHRAAEIARVYRGGWRWLGAALGVGIVCDALFVLSMVAVACALPLARPGLIEHFVVVPLSMIAGALPISPSGLGTVEATVELLYKTLGKAAGVATGDGTLVALAHRCAMLVVGAVAAGYYFFAPPTRDLPESAASATATNTAAPGSGTLEAGAAGGAP